uniref:CSON009214 protein n=1 Tax=Culicoides sonorensis TaxID=179676 RepID=A0A336MZN8_CULSO
MTCGTFIHSLWTIMEFQHDIFFRLQFITEIDKKKIDCTQKTEERSIQLAVRVHKTLELADDKFYVITCGKTGFSRDDKDMGVVLKFLDGEKRVRETVYGREYLIKAEVQQPNATYGIKVKNCFAFNKRNISIELIDDRGCPFDNNIITPFATQNDGKSAVAMLKSMFKFAEGSEVHFQCDIEQCSGRCAPVDDSYCKTISSERLIQDEKQRDLGQAQNGLMLAASSVFVIDPDQAPLIAATCDGIHPPWLLWLCIALGVLFLIMLLMNIFLCTAMSCSCARTEIIEKEPSIIEEYDPYRSWHGSQYGSRYSLHGRENGINKGYTSGGSTIHSNRSIPIDSDHYAIVHSRPGSRHSNVNGHRSRNM